MATDSEETTNGIISVLFLNNAHVKHNSHLQQDVNVEWDHARCQFRVLWRGENG